MVLGYLYNAPFGQSKSIKHNGGHHHGLNDAKLQFRPIFGQIAPGNDPNDPLMLVITI